MLHTRDVRGFESSGFGACGGSRRHRFGLSCRGTRRSELPPVLWDTFGLGRGRSVRGSGRRVCHTTRRLGVVGGLVVASSHLAAISLPDAHGLDHQKGRRWHEIGISPQSAAGACRRPPRRARRDRWGVLGLVTTKRPELESIDDLAGANRRRQQVRSPRPAGHLTAVRLRHVGAGQRAHDR
jgi:hypothetical protein